MTNFGRDVSCTTSLRTGRYATGGRLVAEAAYRRLSTPRGKLRGGDDEANYGFDLSEQIGAVASNADALALGGRIRSELRKDPRIESVTATVTATRAGPSTTYVVTVQAKTSEGPFTLAVSVDEVSVELLGIRVEE